MGPLREVQLTLTPSNRLRARACQAAAWRPAEAGDGSTGDAPPAGCDHGHRAAGPPPWLPFFPHPLLPGERMTPTRAPSLASPLSPSFSCSPFQLSLHSLHPTPLPFLPRPSHQSLISEVKKARSRGPHVTCWRAGALCSTMFTSVSAFAPVVGAVCWGRLSQTVQGKWHPLEL